MIELGKTYYDKVTKFKGVATGHVKYITGCNQVLLNPEVDKDGKLRDAGWFDEQRLVEHADTEKFGKVVLDNTETPGCDIAAPIR